MPHKGTYKKPTTKDPVYDVLKDRAKQIDEAVEVPPPTSVVSPPVDQYVSDTRTERNTSQGVKVWNDKEQRWDLKK
jgi:hypothetical protein